MEEQASANNDLMWIKTLQGLVLGVQCLGGEIPFFFLSGCIIKKTGHANCMALTLGCMAVKMYLYTVVPNPTWIALVELLNGLSFALGIALKMSYAKMIAPLDTLCTVVGLLSVVDNIGMYTVLLESIINEWPIKKPFSIGYLHCKKSSV